jgi:hypothetical protein
VTPPGIEGAENITKPNEDRSSPTKNPRSAASSRGLTKRSGSKVAKLAAMAANALRNLDLDRAMELIEQIRATCGPESRRPAAPTLKVIK